MVTVRRYDCPQQRDRFKDPFRQKVLIVNYLALPSTKSQQLFVFSKQNFGVQQIDGSPDVDSNRCCCPKFVNFCYFRYVTLAAMV